MCTRLAGKSFLSFRLSTLDNPHNPVTLNDPFEASRGGKTLAESGYST